MKTSGRAPAPAPKSKHELTDSAVTGRILDAALERFSAQGITATTMGELAADAGISRAWLYRKYPSRYAVVQALVARETQRLIAGLMEAADTKLELADSLANAFVFVVSQLRGSALLRRVLVSDREAIAPYLLGDAASLLQSGAELIASVLRSGGLRPAQAKRLADTFVRLTLSIAVIPDIGTDFDNPKELRSYANEVVRKLFT